MLDRALLVALALAATPAAAAPSAPVLVELFTSEGCDSCPPADAVLARLVGREDVLPLEFHVTYWDSLGWPDPFGDQAFTARQRAYARQLGTSTVYTPQMMVGGVTDVEGSDAPRLVDAIHARQAAGGTSAVSFAGSAASLPETTLEHPAELWFAAYDAHHQVAVERGENAGRTLDHHNVVRELARLGSWDGRARTLDLPLDRLRREGRAGVAVAAQDPQTGRVVAVGRLGL
jgi:hypothetical protein